MIFTVSLIRINTINIVSLLYSAEVFPESPFKSAANIIMMMINGAY